MGHLDKADNPQVWIFAHSYINHHTPRLISLKFPIRRLSVRCNTTLGKEHELVRQIGSGIRFGQGLDAPIALLITSWGQKLGFGPRGSFEKNVAVTTENIEEDAANAM